MSTKKQEKQLVNRLARKCLIKLRANRDRGHWRDAWTPYLRRLLLKKLRLLIHASEEGDRIMAWCYAADVANIAAMIADNT